MLYIGHVDDVKAIVQRAIKDLSIEQSLKKYEEIWLSKVFELTDHVRNSVIQASIKDTGASVSSVIITLKMSFMFVCINQQFTNYMFVCKTYLTFYFCLEV